MMASGMTAWEYAHSLYKAHGFSPSDAEVCDVLTVTLLGSLPANQRSHLERFPVIVLPTRQANAMCIASDSGVVIVLDRGLLSFLNVLNKVVLCRLNIFGLEPIISLTEAKRLAEAALQYFLNGDEELPRWPVPPKRLLIASALSNVQVAFVVGHELGHVLLGHLGERSVAPVVESRSLGVPAFSFKDLHEQEFAADREAAKMVISHFARIYDPLFGGNEPSYSQAGPDIFFSYVELLESAIPQFESSTTHPPTELRREKLREAMWSKIPEPSRILAESFDSIVELIKSGDLEDA